MTHHQIVNIFYHVVGVCNNYCNGKIVELVLQITKNIGDVTKALDKAMSSMDLEKVQTFSAMELNIIFLLS